jgi:hypothetical protein
MSIGDKKMAVTKIKDLLKMSSDYISKGENYGCRRIIDIVEGGKHRIGRIEMMDGTIIVINGIPCTSPTEDSFIAKNILKSARRAHGLGRSSGPYSS